MIPYGFSAEDFGRVARSVRRSEGLPPRRDQQTPGPSGGIAAPHNWIYVTSTTLQTITLANGEWQGYQAIWGYPDSDSGEWVQTTNQVWFLTPNGETPVADKWIKAHCIGADASGQTIWAADIAGSTSDVVLLQTTSSVSQQVTGVSTGATFTVFPAQENRLGGQYWMAAENGVEFPPQPSPAVKICVQVDADSNGIPICVQNWEEYTFGVQTAAFNPNIGSTFSVAYAGENCAAFGLNGTSSPTVPLLSGSNFFCFGKPDGSLGGDLLVVGGPSAFSNQFVFAPGPYLGMTGTDPNGSQFLNGWCITIGAGLPCTGGTGSLIAGAGITIDDNAPVPGQTTIAENSNNGTIDGGTWI